MIFFGVITAVSGLLFFSVAGSMPEHPGKNASEAFFFIVFATGAIVALLGLVGWALPLSAERLTGEQGGPGWFEAGNKFGTEKVYYLRRGKVMSTDGDQVRSQWIADVVRAEVRKEALYLEVGAPPDVNKK